MQGIKIRGVVLFEKSFDARCRTLLPGSLPGSFERTGIFGRFAYLSCMGSLPGSFEGTGIFSAYLSCMGLLPGCFDKGVEHHPADLFSAVFICPTRAKKEMKR